MKLLIACFSAVAAPTILVCIPYLIGQFLSIETNVPYIWVRTGIVLIKTFLISSGFVFLLGLPAYFLLRYLKLIRWWSTLLTGFSLAAIPMAFLTWPLIFSDTHLDIKTNSTMNGVQTMIDGVPTTAGWIYYLGGVTYFGAFGLIAALAFWFVIRKISR